MRPGLPEALALWLSTIIAVSALAEPCADGPTGGAVTAYCGFVAPEDVVLVDDSYLIISTMTPASYLHGFDLASESVLRLETRLTTPPADQRWGDASCEVPASMISHGLDLSVRADGESQLLVVNHGARESIEYFSMEMEEDELVLQWRGCVMAADNAQFNDVAGLPDGGFLATDPITASWQLLRMITGSLGMATGQVYRWRPGAGYEAVANTEGAYPNGILLSADGRSFYLNLYLDGEVREHDLETGAIINRVSIEMPDNSSLDGEGNLLVASHHASSYEIVEAIASEAHERNNIAFDIVEVDPDTFAASVRFSAGGNELGGGTIAQEVGDDLFIGAFRGDRIIRVRVPPAP